MVKVHLPNKDLLTRKLSFFEEYGVGIREKRLLGVVIVVVDFLRIKKNIFLIILIPFLARAMKSLSKDK